jgi:hypothetical protein
LAKRTHVAKAQQWPLGRETVCISWPLASCSGLALLSFASPPRYTRATLAERKPMSDMRLIVAGAGGRMGRTLIHAIAAAMPVSWRGWARTA